MTMKEVSTSELKAKLSEHLGKVEEGAAIYVTSHGRRVAELSPVVERGDLGISSPRRPVADLRELGKAGVRVASAEGMLMEDRGRR